MEATRNQKSKRIAWDCGILSSINDLFTILYWSSPDDIPLWDGYKIAVMYGQKLQNRNKWCRHFLGKFPEIVQFPKRAFLGILEILKILRGKPNGMEIPSKKFLESLVYPMSPFPEIMENAVLFITGNFWEFKPEFFIEWSALTIFVSYTCITTTHIAKISASQLPKNTSITVVTPEQWRKLKLTAKKLKLRAESWN